MIDPAESEIDVEELKGRIRAAVEQRESEGKTSFIAASRELYKLLSANGSADNASLADLLIADISSRPHEEPQLSLQPVFQPNPSNRYRLEELLQYHDHQFIWNAYRAILKREPDEQGYQGYLALLRSGRRNKIDILASLRFSSEGQRANVEVEGLKAKAWFRRFYQVPVLGYLAELIVSIVRLPTLLRYQRQMEHHVTAQQDIVVAHFSNRLENQSREIENQTRKVNEANLVVVKLAESLSNLKKRQNEFAEVQHQQLVALFRNQQLPQARTGLNGQQHGLSREWDELYAALASQFRGESESVKNELRHYVSLLKDAGISSEVLDLGCGRGEWLEILKESEVGATGLEANTILAAEARQKDLAVLEADALEYLRQVPGQSLQAVTAFHLVEHLEFSQLVELLSEIKRVLKPNGIVILETPNPKNLVVGACNFYSDPSHHRPLFPETVEFLLNHVGFVQVRIEYLHPAAGSPFTSDSAGSKELDTWLFGPRDFAAIARK